MTPSLPISLTVEDTQPTRFDRWIKRQYPGLTQGLLEKLLRQGKIKRQGKRLETRTRVSCGDQIDLYLNVTPYLTPSVSTRPASTRELSAKQRTLLESITLWEDQEILVLNKPTQLAVQGGTGTSEHIDGLLRLWGQEKNVRYRLVHRIDRDTTGILLIAKTQSMAQHLTQQFRDNAIQKIYWAVVLGHPKPGRGTVRAPLRKSGGHGYEKVVVDPQSGKEAVTHYRIQKRMTARSAPALAWLTLSPQTGRTHQIRVHCQHLQTPIIGDGKYGGAASQEFSRTLHLHARSVSLRDCDGNALTFTAPPPAHFEETLQYYGIEWSTVSNT